MAQIQHVWIYLLLWYAIIGKAVALCPDLTAPINGNIHYDGRTEDSEASYTCDIGYDLIGTVNRQICQADDTWSDTPPTCNPKDCGTPATVANGQYSLLDGTSTYQSRVQYTCTTGYDLSDSTVLVCSSSGAYTPSVPTCTIHNCGTVPDLTNGAVAATGTTYGEAVTYSCDTGYDLYAQGSALNVASLTSTCTTTTWEMPIPNCMQDTEFCPAITIADGTYTGSRVYQATVTFTCNTGYTITGATTVTCTNAGTWSDGYPTCTIVSCGTPAQVTNGNVVTPGALTYGETATYTCNTGYNLNGDATKTCQTDGSWSGATVSCIEQDCGGRNHPTNGLVSLLNGDTTYGAVASYTCDTGYQLIGDNTLECEMTGWDPTDPPTCQIWDCGAPGVPNNGEVTYTAGPGGNTEYQAIAAFSCNTGYTRSGVAQRTCQHGGQWSGSQPTCNPVDCNTPAAPANGFVATPLGTTYEQTATFTCATGYVMTSGSSTAVCQADGQWSTGTPTCTIYDCGGRGNPTNGLVSLVNGDTTYGAVASYTCNTGYQLIGDNTLDCLITGWDPTNPPTCQIWDCGVPASPTNGGVVTSGGTTYLDEATYSCNTGYTLSGVSQRTCQDGGQWSDSTPSCNIVDCNTPTAPTNGFVATPLGTTYEQTATFTCTTGYVVTSGSSTAVCQADGQWSTGTPTCTIYDCGGRGNPTNGLVSLVNGDTTYGAVASYTCNTGYQLIGDNTLDCLITGWDPSNPPTCQIWDCGVPASPANGGVATSGGTTYLEEATYSCNTGYTRSGVAQRTCQDGGQWSDSMPSCNIVDCNTPAAPADGFVAAPLGTTYGETATFTCTMGYVMAGSSSAVCQADGQWSSVPPTCTRYDCGGRSHPTNGLVSLLNGDTTYGAVASYTCDTGYQLIGDNTLECEMTGWDPTDPPTCQIWDCGVPASPTNGVATSGGTTYLDMATYSCNTGYTRSGVAQRTCQDGGQWSDSTPSCNIVDCNTPAAPTNGFVAAPLGTTYGETATFTCTTGYVVSGSSTAVCQADGQWSTGTTCTRYDCGGKNNPANGLVSLVNGDTTYGAVATYTCNTGYQLIGDSTLDCLITGWDPTNPPTCQIWDCGVPTSPTNGGVATSGGTTYLDEATYSCNTGYTRSGVSQRTCQDGGQWSDSMPSCNIVDCNTPAAPTNGFVAAPLGTTYGETATFTCTTGYVMSGSSTVVCQADGQWSTGTTCTRYDCGGRGNPTNGLVSLVNGDTSYEAVASYTCNTGYQLIGDNTLECTLTGWNPSPPTCQIWDCGSQLQNPANGQVSIPAVTKYQSVVTYSCLTGYNLAGTSTRTCQHGGSWSGTAPSCVISDCGTVVFPNGQANLNVEVSGTTYGATATFSCVTGYQLTGFASITCLAGGSWSGPAPTCQPADCGALSLTMDNGQVQQTGTTYGQTTVYTCDVGYHIRTVGTTQTVTCQANGFWDSTRPACTRVDCGDLGAPENGQVAVQSSLYLEIAAYTCNLGYDLVGSNHRQCEADAMWNRAPPECRAVDCGTLTNPDFGTVSTPGGTKYGQLATYTCNTGYHVTAGNSIRTCETDGNWDGSMSTCSIYNCGPLSTVLANGQAVQTGTTFGHTTTYTCNQGYYITTSLTTLLVTCAADGNWDDTAPTCTAVACETLSNPGNGEVSYTSVRLDAVAQYSCNIGYHLDGNSQRVCQQNGQWSGSIPSCVPIDCGIPLSPQFGQVTTPGSTLYGNVATYSCRTGYKLEGLATRLCEADGTWQSEVPTCTIHDCGPLQDTLTNGQVVQTGTKYQNYYIYTCDRGYFIADTTITTRTVTCTETGEWSGSAPTCGLIDCGPLQTPADGDVSTTSGSVYQSVATYSCQTGYELRGSSTRTCQADASWDGARPTCEIYDCGPLDNPENGRVILAGGTTYSQVAEYRCNEGYAITGPSSTRTCEAGGEWNGSEPSCLLYDCGLLTNPENSIVTLSSGTTYGSRATYTCNTGYFRSEGNMVRDCEFDSGWSGNPPVCTIYDCQELQHPINGRVTLAEGTTYGEVAEYTCNAGFFISDGSERRVCQSNGLWDGVAPSCTIYECSSLFNPADGSVAVTMTDYGERADYTCRVGYYINSGSQTRMCLTGSSTWNGTQPTCAIHNCGNILQSLENGQVSGFGMLYGDQIVFTCNNGYLISGTDLRAKTVTCTATGKWSDNTPTCTPIDCGTPDQLENGDFTMTSTGLGAVASYNCDEGYRLIGQGSVTCLDSGAWSNTAPECSIYDCGSLSNPAQGIVMVSRETFGGMATYTCNTGYFISSGSETRLCRDGGNWDGTIPICTERDCGLLSKSLANGVAIQTGTNYMDTTTYRCDPGYHIDGSTSDSTTVICTASGAWSDVKPECVIVDCGVLMAPANGFVNTADGTQYLDVATYRCETGHRLNGVGSVICQDNSQWSNSAPTCELFDCGPLSNPANGFVSLNGGTRYGSIAQYSCSAGYHINYGSERRTCTDDGTWDGLAPTCADIQTIACGFRNMDIQVMLSVSQGVTVDMFRLAQAAVKGLVDKSDIDSGSTRFSLISYNTDMIENLSFMMNSFTTREALKEAIDDMVFMPYSTLSNTAKALEILQYMSDNATYGNRPTIPDNAVLITDVVTNSEYALQLAEDVRNKGVTLNVVGINIADTSTLEGLAFSAVHVYQMQDYSELLQLPGMMFEHPHCDCGTLPNPANGFLDLSDGSYYLDEAVYTCNQGYLLTSEDSRECQYEGNWAGTAPICTEIDCGQLQNPEHGVVQMTDTNLFSSATYTCNSGYLLTGPDRMICEASGGWNPSPAVNRTTCELIDCGPLLIPSNGNMAFTGTTFEHQARFVCNTGYSLVGEEDIVCQADGAWSSEEPVCQPKICGYRDTDILMMIGISPWMTSTDFNLHVKGAMKYVIGKSDLDTDRSRFAFFFFDNGIRDNFGSVFEFANRSTQYDKIDSIPFVPSTFPSNVSRALETMLSMFDSPMSGSRFSAPDYAKLVTENLPLSQDQLDLIRRARDEGIGLEVVGMSSILTAVAQTDDPILDGLDLFTTYSEWTQYLKQQFEHPHCNCGSLLAPVNGFVSVFGTYYHDEAIYSCNQGYLRSGSDTRVCQYEGSWGGITPQCVEIDCGPLQTPANGNMFLPGTNLGSTARFTCNSGYQLEGANMTTCETSGEWSRQEPVCEWIIKECSQLFDPVDGTVILSAGLSLGSVATYTCNTGYYLVGSASRLCLASGQWDGQEPVCEIHDCGLLQKPANGNLEMTGMTYGEVATFSCSVGFQLFGADTITCTKDGVWSDSVPMCRETDCGSLSNIPNGTVTFVNSTFGQLATYMCNQGFIMSGAGTRVCQADGQWSGTPPACMARDCGEVSVFPNGVVQYSAGTRLGATVTFTCNAGYQLVGSSTLICMGAGSWSGVFPECLAIGCGSLSVGNGTVTFTDGFGFNSRAQYTCNQGYYMTGPPEKLCTVTGWSPATPTACTLHDCGTPGRPFNGTVTVRGGTTYGQMAEFSCNMGYTMVGSQSIICQANGNWSALPPVCMVTDCLDLPNPQNGSVSASETTFGQVAVYTCNIGYTLTGISSRICMLNGSWSGQAPLCEVKDCGMHPAPASGRVVFPNGTTYGKNGLFYCNEGYTLIGLAARVCGPNGFWVGDPPTCTVIDCGQVPDVPNGQVVNSPSNTFGSVATYACDTGYQLFGSAQITCLTTGRWTTSPICSIITCGPLEPPAQGSVDVSGGVTFGQMAIYSCFSGYTLTGNQIRTCTEQGVWSGAMPMCELINCGPLVSPQNGQVTVTGTSFGDSAMYTCDVGHRLVGTPNRLCQNNGGWSDTRPLCLIQNCGDLRMPSNGQMTQFTGTTYGSMAEFTCNLMYNLIGPSSLVCRADGSWSGSPPACILGDELTSVDMILQLNLTIASSVNLLDNATNTMYTAEARDALLTYYRSKMGNDVHDTVVTSVQDGSLIVPFYIVLTNDNEAFLKFAEATSMLANNAAPLPMFNTNTYAQSMQVDGQNVDLGVNTPPMDTLLCITYLAAHGPCDSGYMCTVNNMEPSYCGMPAGPVNGREEFPNGNLYGATMIYTCNTGFTLVGDNTRTCQASGDWAPAAPVCMVTDCGELTDPQYGDASTTSGTSYLTTGLYTCMSGYTLIGTAVVTCQANGRWSAPPPVCVITRCGTLMHPINGNVTLSPDGQTAMYRCNLGYRLVGSSMRVCQLSGQWDGTVGSCEIITCGALTNPPNGRVDVSSTINYGQTATYMCVGPEYELMGSRVRTCTEDGSWSGSVPSCSLRDCGMLDVISNGDMQLTGTRYGDTAAFTCNNAYSLQGAALLTCRETGWDNPQPMCIHIGDCGPLSHPNNGAVNVSEGTSIGSVARYQCYTGYVLVGEAHRECLQGSKWAGMPPTCRIQTCPSLMDQAGGSVQLSGNLTYGQTATYICDTGYDMSGPATITCQEDGTWSAVTTCKIKDCGPLPDPLNGVVDVVTGTQYGASAQITCNPGYSIIGPSARKCGATGQWSLTDPSCMAMDCGELTAPINGFISLPGGTTFGSAATYTCDTGYDMTGSSQQQCGADGQWTGTPPVCVLIECATIAAQSNGRITVTQGSYYGSIAIYACDIGYNLFGVHRNRTCMANRLWSGTPPACVLADCGIVSAPLFGSVSLSSGTSYNSVATYMCSTGYAVDGVAERSCHADGTWSGTVPSCVVVDCGGLPDPKNGKVSAPQGTRYGRTATYLCDSDNELDGAKTRTCQADGSWSLAAPTCESEMNHDLVIGLAVGLSAFFIIVLIVILVAVIMYRRNLDKHELRMTKYGTRSKIIEVQTPVPTASYALPLKMRPRRSSHFLPHFRHTDDDSEVSDYRTRRADYSNTKLYYQDSNLPRDEYYTLQYRP